MLSVGKILRQVVPSLSRATDGLVSLQSHWTAVREKGLVEVNARVEDSEGVDVLRLTVAALLAPAGPVGELGTYANDAHALARQCFESLITDEFREVLKGEGVE